ncbi:MAG TPA: Rrf2 family transcriptional regulator [Planctomycetota bacterium]|nr:Rrf2 family transcriptional regulator [Planctomycetota bacterium]
MAVSSRFAVAVHVLALLAYFERHGGDRVPSGTIARSVNTNAAVIRRLLGALKRAGLVDAKEGKGGGARLARRPSAISLEDVHAAVEAESVVGLNRTPRFKKCPVSCGMAEAMPALAAEVDAAVARVLRGRTLAQLIAKL